MSGKVDAAFASQIVSPLKSCEPPEAAPPLIALGALGELPQQAGGCAKLLRTLLRTIRDLANDMPS